MAASRLNTSQDDNVIKASAVESKYCVLQKDGMDLVLSL